MTKIVFLLLIFALTKGSEPQYWGSNLSEYIDHPHIVHLAKSNTSGDLEFENIIHAQIHINKNNSCCLHGQFAGNHSNTCIESLTLDLSNEDIGCQEEFKRCCLNSKKEHLCDIGITHARIMPFEDCNTFFENKDKEQHSYVSNCCTECQKALLKGDMCEIENSTYAFRSCCDIEKPQWPIDNSNNLYESIQKYFSELFKKLSVYV